MSRIRIGVVGCGLIGQMMHLPHLKELHELYEVVALCDVSPGTSSTWGTTTGSRGGTRTIASFSRRPSTRSWC